MSFNFDIDSDDFVKFTNKLEKIHQSALPNAIRGTLNSLAFDVKSRTMPYSAKKNFVNRKKNFFKANSKVVKAKGFDIDRMESTIGFLASNQSKNNKAVQELEQQEFGGKIKDRGLIPLQGARITKNRNRMISKNNRLSSSQLKRLKKTGKKGFVKEVMKVGVKGFVRTEKSILKVTSIKKSKKGLEFGFNRIYMINKSKVVKIEKTNFMREAGERSIKKAGYFYRKKAERQFERALRI